MLHIAYLRALVQKLNRQICVYRFIVCVCVHDTEKCVPVHIMATLFVSTPDALKNNVIICDTIQFCFCLA